MGRNALRIAVLYGNTPIVKWLLKTGGARISDVNNRGLTALSIAATNGHHFLVQWPLEEGGAKITDAIQLPGQYRSLSSSLYGSLMVASTLRRS
jgi:ankyrin repeat protein